MRRARLVAAAVALVALAPLLTPLVITRGVAARLRAAGRERGWVVSWSRLQYVPAFGFRIAGLRMLAADGDTLGEIDSLSVTLEPLALLALQARPRTVKIAHVRWRARAHPAADAVTLAAEEATGAGGRPARPDRSGRVRGEAAELVRMLLLPARRLPRLELRDLSILAADEDTPSLRLAWLSLAPGRSGIRFSASGAFESGERIPFDLDLGYDDADRLVGGARFLIPDPDRGTHQPLMVALEGRMVQDRRRGTVVLADSTRVRLGRLTFHVAGRIQRAGPRFSLRLDAAGLDAAGIRASVPRPLLGPLAEVAVRGSFDYHAAIDLDFAHPDSLELEADVVPHALALDPGANRLPLGSLAGPFVATVHLPHQRTEPRELSSANPHFLPLDRIDSSLVHAVITNEDGGFFRHRGFNLDAVRHSVTENIQAAAWRRGAGTISMQLVRNLYLGHARTLSRKGQEVVLTWLIEHLSGLDKRRMLEIYLNIIEWGPGVLGADEGAHYFFGHDATRLTVSEALFMATVLPSPNRWRGRFEPDGRLRPFECAQMHFIGRAMIAKGWLAPEQLPAADSLRVDLAGPAREALAGPEIEAAWPPPRPAAADSLEPSPPDTLPR